VKRAHEILAKLQAGDYPGGEGGENTPPQAEQKQSEGGER
jgi:hypothetical protein